MWTRRLCSLTSMLFCNDLDVVIRTYQMTAKDGHSHQSSAVPLSSPDGAHQTLRTHRFNEALVLRLPEAAGSQAGLAMIICC